MLSPESQTGETMRSQLKSLTRVLLTVVLLAGQCVGCSDDTELDGSMDSEIGTDTSPDTGGDNDGSADTTDQTDAALGLCEGPAVALDAALAEAEAGDTVVAEPGTYTGPLTVPAGVTVCGSAEVEIEGDGDNFVLRVASDSGLTTAVYSLSIVSRASEAVLVVGDGDVLRYDLSIESHIGL